MNIVLTERDQSRFWSKVALPDGEGCMLWMAGRVHNGYGRFKLNGRMVYAHRISYAFAYGEIPNGLVLDHLCRVRLCMAPGHLEAVTNRENLLRGEGFVATNAQKARCPQGHPYTPENTYASPKGWRNCRTCKRGSERARRARMTDGGE